MYNTKRWIALAATASLTLAACGTDSSTSITTTTAIGGTATTGGAGTTAGPDVMTEGTGDTMTGDTMTGDTMTSEVMTGDTTMTSDAMTGDTMTSEVMTGSTMADGATGDVMATALADPNFSILAEAIQAAGLQDALSGPGPFTILAPQNSAFERTFSFLGTTKEAFMADKDGLANLLSYHVIPGSYPLADLANLNGARLATLQGTDVTVTVDADGKIKMNTGPLLGTESLATNGVILPIDEVLFPKPGK